jgi:hypothetical protein
VIGVWSAPGATWFHNSNAVEQLEHAGTIMECGRTVGGTNNTNNYNRTPLYSGWERRKGQQPAQM